MTDLLAEMAAASRARVERARAEVPDAEIRAIAAESPLPKPLRLGTFDVFAEVKFAAPSAGALAIPDLDDAVTRATAYADAGAAAISVLTEPTRFLGAPEHLYGVSRAVRVPAMRKDFLVDPYQVWEARAWGASGVLLIVRMLDDATLARTVDTAVEAGLFTLLECFDESDLARVRVVPGVLVGVNTRDLQTLRVDADRLEALHSRIPPGVVAVAESGMETPEDVARAARSGYAVALVGTALMRSEDPHRLVASMLEAGRSCA